MGARLAVKEPYFKRYQDGMCGLRVDNPADIVFLPPAHEDDDASAGAGGGAGSGVGAGGHGIGGGGGGADVAGGRDPKEICRRGNALFE